MKGGNNFSLTAKFELISYFGPDSVPHFVDDLCLVNLLKASCLKWMDSPLQAEECLRTVVGNAAKLEVKFKINSNMCTCIWKIEMGIIAGRHVPCPLLPLRAGRAIEGAGAGGAGGGDAGGGKVNDRKNYPTNQNKKNVVSRPGTTTRTTAFRTVSTSESMLRRRR